jgi:hypothetical protein
MMKIVSIFIILIGFLFFVYGSLPLAAIAWAFATGQPVPHLSGRWALLMGGGLTIIAYGWQCVKGFKLK